MDSHVGLRRHRRGRAGIQMEAKIETMTVHIIGTEKLMVHKFWTGHNGKDVRYLLPDGSDGLPCGMIKACILKGLSNKRLRERFRIVPSLPEDNLVQLICPQGHTLDKSSGHYWPWSARFSIDFVEFVPTLNMQAQLLDAISKSGCHEGLGENRPGQTTKGLMGTFTLAKNHGTAGMDRDWQECIG